MNGTWARPPGYETDLSEYKPCLFDSCCGEPVAWGFEIVRRLGEDRFEALRQFGSLQYGDSKWFLITRELTRAEAIDNYGPITAEEFGPRGGWKSVTFGNKRFFSRTFGA